MDAARLHIGARGLARAALAALVYLVIGGCGGPQPAPSPPSTAPPQPQPGAPTPQPTPVPRLTGTVEVDGSSTVFLITEAAAEEFRKLQPKVKVNVGISGTGGGFERFVAGDTDLSDASRPITETEGSAAQQNGVEYVQLRIAMDGLSMIANPQNDFLECLTIEELRAIWEPGSEIRTWRDVRGEWPDRPIRLYGPGTDSGTFDYFTETIVGQARASRSDYTASEDDNVLVLGVAGDRNSLGYLGYAYYQQNRDKLKLLAVDSGNGCVAPTPEAVEEEWYPLARPLFIYVNRKSLERPAVRGFVEFYLENAGNLAAEVGYISLTGKEYAEHLEKLK